MALTMLLSTVIVAVVADPVAPPIGYREELVERVPLDDVPEIQSFWNVSSDVYQIKDEAGLLFLSSEVAQGNSFAEKTLYLANDISLSEAFSPIGVRSFITNAEQKIVIDEDLPFSGTFDGQGRTVSNLKLKSDAANGAGVGLFVNLKGTVKNLILDESCSVVWSDNSKSQYLDYGSAAVIAAYTENAVFYNISTRATLVSAGHAAALSGRGSVTRVENCSNFGSITGNHTGGGLLGFDTGGDVFCSENYGVISADKASGIVGRSRRTQRLENCVNYGTVNGKSYAAGLVSLEQKANVSLYGCINYGTVWANNDMNNEPLFYCLGKDAVGKTDAKCRDLRTVSALPVLTPDAETVGYSSLRIEKADLTDVTDLSSLSQSVYFLNESEYKITSVAGFDRLDRLIAQGVSFQNVTVYLANDVDFSYVEMSPIGWSGQTNTAVNQAPQTAFNGTFDGQGNMVSNVNILRDVSHTRNCKDTTNYAGVSFFGILNGATVKNFIIDSTCSFTYTADPHDHGCAAGLAFAAHNTTFQNCLNMADIRNSSRFSGGIVGRAHGTVTIENCTNTGDMIACQSVGGIVAYSAASSLTVSGCRNMGAVIGNRGYAKDGSSLVGSDHNAGGILGWARSELLIENCVNNGAVMGINCLGGIVGQVGDSLNTSFHAQLLSNRNYGTVTLSIPVGLGAIVPYIAPIGNVAGRVVLSHILFTESDSVDLRGAKDIGYGIEAIVPDYTVEESPVINQTTVPSQTTGIPPAPPVDTIVGYSKTRIEKVNTENMTDLKVLSKSATQCDAREYKITSVIGFERLDDLIRNGVDFTGITIYLANDVDFAGVEFSPIGWSGQLDTAVNKAPQKAFNGTFDGQGYAVTNVFCMIYESHELNSEDTVNYSGVSFFGILKNATVRNFVVDSSCSFLYLADPDDHGCAAGIAFAAYNTVFDNCINMAEIVNDSRFSGGIVARAHGAVTVNHCTNVGPVSGCQNAAGLVAYSTSVLNVVNCRNVGSVSCEKGYSDTSLALVGSDHSAAGMVGWIRENATVVGCVNNGNVIGVDNVAGIVGQLGNTCGSDIIVALNDNINYGLISLSEDSKTETNTGGMNLPLIAVVGNVWAENNIKGSFTDHRNKDLRGEEDESLKDVEFPQNPNETTTPPFTTMTNKIPAETITILTTSTVQPTETTASQSVTVSDTTASNVPTMVIVTDTTPTKQTDEGEQEPVQLSCSSTAFGGIAVIMLVSGAAVTLLKKKED